MEAKVQVEAALRLSLGLGAEVSLVGFLKAKLEALMGNPYMKMLVVGLIVVGCGILRRHVGCAQLHAK